MGLVRMRPFFRGLVNHLSHCTSCARVFMLRLGEWLRRGARRAWAFIKTNLIGVLGILVVAAQVKIMCEQTKISDRQSTLQEMQTLPQFIINRQSGERSGEETLTIANEGFAVQRLDHQWAVYLFFEVESRGSYRVAVRYYCRPDGDKAGKGLLRTILPVSGNASSLARIQKEFQDVLEERKINKDKGRCSLQIRLRLDWWNILGQMETQYFWIDPGHGARVVPAEAKEKTSREIKEYQERKEQVCRLGTIDRSAIEAVVCRLLDDEIRDSLPSGKMLPP